MTHAADIARGAWAPPRASAIVCRRLRPGEAALYRALRLDSLHRCPDSFGATHAEESSLPKLPFEQAIEDDAPDRFVAGAFRGERLVGIAAFARRDRSKTRHRGYFSQVYVAPDQRGQAAGSNLMRAALRAAFSLRGLEQVELSVVAANTVALRLYEQLGFRRYGLQENYFKVGARRWHMCLMQLTRDRFFADNHPTATPGSTDA